ncbi:MAG: hypothetical protein EA350_02815 [Gemmatimonadales bacterium]|nr:MAG: hypothetical protein EA350_02815 [Gemmatimonadales bacterium]
MDEELEGPVLLKVGDDVSTDDILPAGARILPYRSNIPAISRFAFENLGEGYQARVRELDRKGHMVVAGSNYGQGSSREHAALAPRYLGVLAILARSFARIHQQNLANFGILPLVFENPEDWERIEEGDVLRLEGVRTFLSGGEETLEVRNGSRDERYRLLAPLTRRQREMILAGSVLNLFREERMSG